MSSTRKKLLFCPTAIKLTTASVPSPTGPSRARSWDCHQRALCFVASTIITKLRLVFSTVGCGYSSKLKAACFGFWKIMRQHQRNLRKEAEARGVNADRLIFAKRMSVADHLARHRLADLFLDTLPYNAHTTASDALMGWVACVDMSWERHLRVELLPVC